LLVFLRMEGQEKWQTTKQDRGAATRLLYLRCCSYQILAAPE
jgi:hypothetical protein